MLGWVGLGWGEMGWDVYMIYELMFFFDGGIWYIFIMGL